jgi:hypothetical protein
VPVCPEPPPELAARGLVVADELIRTESVTIDAVEVDLEQPLSIEAKDPETNPDLVGADLGTRKAGVADDLGPCR